MLHYRVGSWLRQLTLDQTGKVLRDKQSRLLVKKAVKSFISLGQIRGNVIKLCIKEYNC
jgi:hypothetical protein